jgi:hypothetical protein
MVVGDDVDVVLHVVGEVTVPDRDYAVAKFRHALRTCRGPVLVARLELQEARDPARARPSTATATVDVDGRTLRAHADAATMHEAADLLEDRLHRVVEHDAHHARDAHLRHRDGASWHHGDPPTPRPAFFPRPADEREVVVHTTLGTAARTVDEAVDDLERLDHDFLLFTGADAVDCVVYRVAEGYGLRCAGPSPDEAVAAPVQVDADPVPVATVAEAVELLDAARLPFVFFVDAGTGRGRVCHRRRDGHYGLVVGAEAPGPAPGPASG